MRRSPREKALVWIVRPSPSGPEVLLLERPKKRGGGLHPVTGKADAGESPERAAGREADEETGISGALVDLRFSHLYDDPRRGALRETAFLLRAAATAEPKLSSEHVASRWVPGEEADAMLEWPAHRQSLRLALVAFTRRPRTARDRIVPVEKEVALDQLAARESIAASDKQAASEKEAGGSGESDLEPGS